MNTNTEIKRFDLENEERLGGWSSENVMNERNGGDWVRYEDHAAEVARLQAALADMLDKAEAEYWHYKGLQMEAEHAKNFAANMHNSDKVREVLAKAGEYDLMADLFRASQPSPSPAPVAMTDEQIELAECFRAAFDTPIARRKWDGGEAGEYCRKHFRAILAAQQEAV